MMVLYGITLVPLAEELKDADPTLLSPLYTNYVMFDGLARRRVVQLRLLMDLGPERKYFCELAKLLLLPTTWRTRRRRGRNSSGQD